MPVDIIDDVVYHDRITDEKFQTRVTGKLDELEFVHGKTFHRDLMRQTVEDLIKCEDEIKEYDRIILNILAKGDPADIPPKIGNLRKDLMPRIAKLRDQLMIDVGKIKRIAPKQKEEKPEMDLISYEDEDYQA